MTAGIEYDLKVTIIDNAGNSRTSDISTVSTKKRNESGTITDITTDDIIYPGKNSALIGTNVGKTIDYTFTPKTAKFSAELSGGTRSYTSRSDIEWYVWAEDNEYIYIIRKRQ